MADIYYIPARVGSEVIEDKVFINSAKTIEFDATPWAEDNNDITTVTWEVLSGNAGVTNKQLTSNVLSALLSYTDVGTVLIKVTCDTGTEQLIIYYDAQVIDPQYNVTRDYDYCS